MPLTDVLGVLGFVLAVLSLSWQVRLYRALLRVEPLTQQSGFLTVEVVRPEPFGHRSPPPDCRTAISLLLAISNVSIRPNTVAAIEATAHARLDPLPDGAVCSQGRREVTFVEGCPRHVPVPWAPPRAWKLPHRLPPGTRHEAGLSFLLSGAVRPADAPMPLHVLVTDAYGRRYRRTCMLTHRATTDPDVTLPGASAHPSTAPDSTPPA